MSRGMGPPNVCLMQDILSLHTRSDALGHVTAQANGSGHHLCLKYVFPTSLLYPIASCYNKVIQPLLVVPKLAILRFLQTTEISF